MRYAIALLSLLVATASQAQSADLPGGLPNMFGIAVGSTTEYSGGKDRIISGLPGIRYQTKSGHLLEWYGPLIQYNLLGETGWQFGPAINYKMGRKNVKDAVVNQVHEIDTTVEAGAYVGYEYIHYSEMPFRLRATASVKTNFGKNYNGARFSLAGSYWQPLSRSLMVGTGVGAVWVPSSYNQTYYGVTQSDSLASGLPVYTPGNGIQQMYGWLGAIYILTPNWYLGAMVFDQRMMGSAADSPIIRDRGKRDQITFGAGVGYAWK